LENSLIYFSKPFDKKKATDHNIVMEIKHNKILVLLFINLFLIVLVLLHTQDCNKAVWADNVFLEAFTFSADLFSSKESQAIEEEQYMVIHYKRK